jgi:hypothetical protein
MKTAFILAASLASASAFVPAPQTPQSTQLNESFFKKISNMDLWEPVKNSNDYGARNNKKVSVGKLSDRSYVPLGLTKAQYEKIRADEQSKKAANYQRNVAKAGKFLDYTEFYTARGTDLKDSWYNAPNRGHRMAKTKYDWSGETNANPMFTGIGNIKKKAFGGK